MNMMFDNMLFPMRLWSLSPFSVVIGIVLLVLWILMIVDCAKRVFRTGMEKIIWLVIVIFGTWAGALVYFIVIREINPKGIYEPEKFNKEVDDIRKSRARRRK